MLNRLTLAFGAGAVGALVLFGAVWVLAQTGSSPLPSGRAAAMLGKEFLYRQIVWGGLWALLLVLPVLPGRWLVRGALLGVLATLAAIFYFSGGALAQAPAALLATVFALNILWGIAAAFWYDMVATRR